jgi:hypothetical protein
MIFILFNHSVWEATPNSKIIGAQCGGNVGANGRDGVEEEVFLPLKNSAYCGKDEDEGGSLPVKPCMCRVEWR